MLAGLLPLLYCYVCLCYSMCAMYCVVYYVVRVCRSCALNTTMIKMYILGINIHTL